MERAKTTPLSARKKPKRTNKRLVRSIVTYLKSDAYLLSPLFSNAPPFPPQIEMPPPSHILGVDALGIERVKQHKRRLSEKVKEYLKSECHMYGPMISLQKSGSSLKGKLQITNSVTMESSKSSATMREDNNNYRYLRSESDIAQHTKISSHKRHGTGLSRETDLSPPFSPLQEEEIVKPRPRRVPIE